MSGKATTLIAGLGSAHGDDEAGWLTAELLCGMCRAYHDVAVRRALVPLDVLDWLDGIDMLYLCDACEWGSRPGQILQFHWNAGRLVESETSRDHRSPMSNVPFRIHGSHDFSLPEMLRLAEQTQSLPQRVSVWTIPGSQFQPGATMSESTRGMAIQAAEEIMKDLQRNMRNEALSELSAAEAALPGKCSNCPECD